MRPTGCEPLKLLKLAILSLAFSFIIAAPSQLRADCTDHSFRQISETNPRSDETSNQAFLARLSKASERGVLATIQQWFTFRSAAPMPRSACQPCQRVPFAPGQRCEGPSCSSNPAPATTPVKISTVNLRDSICCLASVAPRNDTTFARQRSDAHDIPASLCTDSIFHPPRSL